MEAAAAASAGGRGHCASQGLVREMRAQGLSDKQVRANLEAKGYKKSRISQLVHAVPLQAAPPPLQRAQLECGTKRKHDKRPADRAAKARKGT